jgi:hypothetical protein
MGGDRKQERQNLSKAGDAMKHIFLVLSIMTLFITSCINDVANVTGRGTRHDIFQTTNKSTRIPNGYAELTIVSSLKTPKPGIYPFGSKVTGTPDYVMMMSVDGQNETIQAILWQEKREPEGLYDPEAGEGIRYEFKKEIMIKAGTHRLVLVLPEEGVIVKRKLTLRDGTTNTIRLKPIYRSVNPEGIPGRGFSGSARFMAGIVGFWVYLNDDSI